MIGAAAVLITVAALPVNASESTARLRIEATDDGYYAWADNLVEGPIEVMLRYRRRHNTDAAPALPARATVPAGQSTVVAVFQATDSSREVKLDLSLESVPGNPSARPRDVTYLLPLKLTGSPVIDQGYDGNFSHDDEENRYAIDFATPEGTPVLAARDGTVMQAEDRFRTTGQDRSAYAKRANFIRILHDDGTMALYAHLQHRGAVAEPGQRVRTGQHIGWSGNTGFTTGPHLHFAIQVNRGMRLVSLPFRMEGVDSPSQ